LLRFVLDNNQEMAMPKGVPVSDVRWAALRELREGEPPTFPRLAAAAELHQVTIRDYALRHGWEKQPYRRSGSRPAAWAAIELPDGELPPEELRARLAAVMPKLLSRFVTLAERGNLDKPDVDAMLGVMRVLERAEALAAELAITEQKRSDEELADLLKRIDDRIVELAEVHAERLVRERDRQRAG
jgi:hypothetical protein